jgi:hypothetical protein
MVAAKKDGPRALLRPRGGGKRKAAPGARQLLPAEGTITLEELLIGFQRSLARATRSSLETARADPQVGLGQRSLYVVDGIGVSLPAGLVMSLDSRGAVQAVSLDLGAAPEQAATLEFRVQARPIEAIEGEQLLLADLDPLGLQRPRYRMRLTLIGAQRANEPGLQPQRAASADALAPAWAPLPQREITIYVIGGDTAASESFRLTTNAAGQVDVQIDALANRIESGDRSQGFERLDLVRRDDDFFVHAVHQDGSGRSLASNVLAFSVKRGA